MGGGLAFRNKSTKLRLSHKLQNSCTGLSKHLDNPTIFGSKRCGVLQQNLATKQGSIGILLLAFGPILSFFGTDKIEKLGFVLLAWGAVHLLEPQFQSVWKLIGNSTRSHPYNKYPKIVLIW